MDIQAKECGSAPGIMLAGRGCVDTVFRQAVNIRMPGDMCLSLVDSKLDSAPNRIILQSGVLDRLSIHPGDEIQVLEDKLCHRDFTISYLPVQDLTKPISAPTLSTIAEIREVLSSGRGACLNYLGMDKGGILEQRVASLAQSLASDQSAGFALVGLGAGFTPAGDDVLTGYCILAYRLGWLDLAWHQQIVERAFTDSTILSATALYFAGRGKGQGYLENVLHALIAPIQLKSAGKTLIHEVGSTSGSDLLLGVLIACQHSLL